MFKKITIFTAVLFTFLISAPVSAAAPAGTDSQIPELNPFCWRKADCDTARKQFLGNDPSQKELEGGFITGVSVAPCTGGGAAGSADEWGRCLPAGTSKTEISFGGKSEFNNIGDFILIMYKYLLTIASIVAVVMVIVAGVQWITSGGNSEAISSAKKRIAGAMIGLFIAYMSYFVLNTINPALVNLRLPQVWLIRPQALMPELCSDLPPKNGQPRKFHLVASKNQPDSPIPPAKERNYKVQEPAAFNCGNRLLAEDGGDTTCRGYFCGVGSGQTCFDKTGSGAGYECGNIRIGGKISYSALATRSGYVAAVGENLAGQLISPWNEPPITDSWLVAVCYRDGKDRKDGRVVNGHGESKNNYYEEATLAQISSAEDGCATHGGLKGFILELAMSRFGYVFDDNDEHHYVGKNGENIGIGLNIGSLGFFSFFFGEISDSIDAKYLFSKEEILRGVHLNIDAGNIPRTQDLESIKKKYSSSP